MKIKSGFMTRRLGDKVVAVAVGPRALEFNGMINLNDTGEFIWKCLENETTIDEVVNTVRDHYDIDIETAKSSVEKFVSTLKENNLLEN